MLTIVTSHKGIISMPTRWETVWTFKTKRTRAERRRTRKAVIGRKLAWVTTYAVED